ncbi:hypothetical protein EYB26_004253 [Talaromyces marneffei]|uniref:uncharacterized protein n=1 Tax=Talaromyces marneffei TaxID=37727 RepID=UPI0012A7D94F|nr:uncharacterized protein EYB26_004253 [Talaromyces marneffei]QGA16586.1 hypothetical protein EYB26_004253 [Talaromyces marneffei]
MSQGLIDSMYEFDDNNSNEEAAAFGFKPALPLHADQTTLSVAPPPPLISPLPPALLPLIITDQAVFDRAQVADQPYCPWTWTTSGRKTDALYVIHEISKW